MQDINSFAAQTLCLCISSEQLITLKHLTAFSSPIQLLDLQERKKMNEVNEEECSLFAQNQKMESWIFLRPEERFCS